MKLTTRRARDGRAATFLAALLATCGLRCNAMVSRSDGPEVLAPLASERSPRRTTASSSAAAARQLSPGTIKLATWNLSWLNAELDRGPVKREEADYARLRKYAQRLDADVIALQEIDGVAAAARVFPPEVYAFYVAEQAVEQRTGFAVRKTLSVTQNPDHLELDVGHLRAGTDITVAAGALVVRLMSVHLKSGCFDEALTHSSGACKKLRQQLPALEAWIDARAAENVPFAVLGDFNRRLFARADEPFWNELDDEIPADADLASPTAGQTAKCWDQKYPQFIDHIVLSKSAQELLKLRSFAQHLYDASDAPKKALLSDHCPLSVVLTSSPADRAPGVGDSPVDAGTPDAASSTPSAGAVPPDAAPSGDIKGNLGSRGKKLYHLPACPQYARVKIELDKGERLFATEAQAQAAGWSKAADCP